VNEDDDPRSLLSVDTLEIVDEEVDLLLYEDKVERVRLFESVRSASSAPFERTALGAPNGPLTFPVEALKGFASIGPVKLAPRSVSAVNETK
jgi:hypothetical protein